MISKPVAALVVLVVLLAIALAVVTRCMNRSAGYRTADAAGHAVPGPEPTRELTALMLRAGNGLTIKSEEVLPALFNTGPEYRRTFGETIVAIGQQKVISENGEGIVTIFLFRDSAAAARAFENASAKISGTNRLHKVDRAIIRLAAKAPTMMEVSRQIKAMQARLGQKGS